MGLILRVERVGGEIGVDFSYRREWFREETMAALNSYLFSILEEIAGQTEMLLCDAGKRSGDGDSSPLMESYADEVFDF